MTDIKIYNYSNNKLQKQTVTSLKEENFQIQMFESLTKLLNKMVNNIPNVSKWGNISNYSLHLRKNREYL